MVKPSNQVPGGQPHLEVWLVEDNDLFRRSIASLLRRTEGISCPVAAASCEDALAQLERAPGPDVVLMDIGLPGMSGIEGVRRVRERSPRTDVLMLTVHEEDEKIFQAICAGAAGYLLKPSSAERIVDAIRQVRAGASPINPYIARRVLEMFGQALTARDGRDDYGLSPREREILELMVEGLTLKQIAARLTVSFHTIDSHTRHIYEKLQVNTRGKAVAKAVKERLV